MPEGNGRFTCHSNTQALYLHARQHGADPRRRRSTSCRLVGGTVGGGFGGKVDVIVEPIAVLAAMLTNRPVKYAYSREEEMQVSSPRAAERIYIKDGVMKDGRIVARKVTLYVDAGAYSRHSPYGTTKAAAHMPGPYTIPNVWVDAYCVYTNRTPSSRDARLRRDDRRLRAGSADGPDRAALGMDPMELRLINAYRDGDMKAHRKNGRGRGADRSASRRRARADWPELAERYRGDVLDEAGGAEHGDAARARRRRGQLPDRHEPRRRPLPGAGPRDDHRQLRRHAVLGRSRPGPQDVMAQICAETLGVPDDNVIVDTADTDTGPHCMGTFASRGTHRIGNAIIMAAKEAREVMLEVAAEELEVDAARPRDRRQGPHPGQGRARRSRSRSSTPRWPRISSTARTISGRGMFLQPRSYPEPETGEMKPDTCHAHACTVAEVEVDDETGEVAVLSLKNAYEIGRALNPAMVEQQIDRRRLDGHQPRALRDDRALLSRPRARPARLQRISDARPRRPRRDRDHRARTPRRRRALRRQGHRAR